MMARRCLIAAAALLLLALATISDARAAGAEDYSYLGVEKLEEELPDSARDVMEGTSISDGFDPAGALRRIVDSAADAVKGIFGGAIKSAVAVLAAAILCSVASGFVPEGSRYINYVNLIGVLVVTSASIGGVNSLIGEATETISDMSAFSKILLPTLASASAAMGAVTSSAAKCAASMLFMDALTTVGAKLVMPMIYMFVAASAATAAFGGGMGGVAKLLARIIKLFLVVIAVAFTIYLTVTGLITSSADAAAVKVTKTAISTLLPVVGGMVSDAADAVASGIMVIRSAAGAFGVVTAIAVCAIPFLKLLCGSLVFHAAAALSETVADARLTALIDSIGKAYGMMLGLAGTNLIMLLISIISMTKAVTGA